MKKKQDSPRESAELGRRILAALISYLEGRATVDSTLKRLRAQSISPAWCELGNELLRYLVNEIPFNIGGKPIKTKLKIQ